MENKFEAGKLKHERLKAFFQYTMIFIIALLFTSPYLNLPSILGGGKENTSSNSGNGSEKLEWAFIAIGVFLIIMWYYHNKFKSLEKKLGWDEKEVKEIKKEIYEDKSSKLLYVMSVVTVIITIIALIITLFTFFSIIHI